MNRDLAIHVIEELIHAGVEDFIICPGGRNAPLVNLIATSSLKHAFTYEERSAAFYGLGVARRTRKPVAIITTSGTAAGELLPAVMEAYYSSIPLILITADRPKRFRGSNAPQTAEQVGLFGVYTPLNYDLEREDRFSLKQWSGLTPLHLNVCFEEAEKEEEPFEFKTKNVGFTQKLPLENSFSKLIAFFEDVKKPLIIVGALTKENQIPVLHFLKKLRVPVYVEGLSGLREKDCLKDIQVYFPRLEDYDSVLRIGRVPTHRIWRDLEESDRAIKVLSITEQPYAGLSFAPYIYTAIGHFLNACPLPNFGEFENNLQSKLREAFWELMLEEPLAEPTFIHQLSLQIPSNAMVYLGNSLPIRNWDLCASYQDLSHDVQATRGLNGIDGQLACFFGLCQEMKENYAIVGDLTALYDFAASFLQSSSFTIFVINNGGGKIFSKQFKSSVFQNAHTLNFEYFAKFWKMPYQLFKSIPSNIKKGGLIEVVPDPQATENFWKKWDTISQEILCMAR